MSVDRFDKFLFRDVPRPRWCERLARTHNNKI